MFKFTQYFRILPFKLYPIEILELIEQLLWYCDFQFLEIHSKEKLAPLTEHVTVREH